MPTPKKGPRLGGGPAHQKHIISNLATSLFEHGAITTTEAKARVLRPVAERLITKAKRGDLHARRQVLTTIRDKGVVHVLFEEIAPRFAERPGGYTRITKLGPRKGDNAPMAVIELLTEEYTPGARRAQDSRTTERTPTEPAAPAPAVEPADAPTIVASEGADEEAFEETEGGVTGKYPGSHAPMETVDDAPEGYPVKGNEDSMKYHTPDGQWYNQTVAEVWFES